MKMLTFAIGCCLLALSFVLSNLPAAAADREFKEFSSFLWSESADPNERRALAIQSDEVDYLVLGDKSLTEINLIDKYMSIISSLSGIRTTGSSQKPKILFLIDENVFSRIVNSPNDFYSLGIQPIDVETWKKILLPSSTCLVQHFSLPPNEACGEIVMMNSADMGCVMKGIFESFGIVASTNDLKSFLNTCVLYQAQKQGTTRIVEFAASYDELSADCKSKMFDQ